MLLDRYFLSIPALRRLSELNAGGVSRMDLVTKAKRSCIAYQQPPVKKQRRGRPAKKGESIKLMTLFDQKDIEFQSSIVSVYGKRETVHYYDINLLWGQKLYQELRFVLVKFKGTQSILVTTDLTLDPLDVIRLYAHRFTIESLFRELKQQVGAFGYHFWSKAMPKLNKFRSKKQSDPLLLVTDQKLQKSILQAWQATERFVQLACIAMGIVQIVSLQLHDHIDLQSTRYLRTPSKEVVSEATVMWNLRKNIFRFMALSPQLLITRIIHHQQSDSCFLEDFFVS